ncbi:MAG: nucleoside deaminase [Candidatus ainarchaeum sp.]|nr:nucleoside deaminase [Candidatus ainarchaeum sp.]
MNNKKEIEKNHLFYMNEAIKEAKKGLNEGGIPIGAVLVKDKKIIGRGHNKRFQKNSAILHAEMDCLENAGRLTNKDYKKCVLYSTLSPCPMCSGAVVLYKIPIIVIGENETFIGAEKYLKSNKIKLINLDSDECKDLMKNFIKKNKKLWFEDIGK